MSIEHFMRQFPDSPQIIWNGKNGGPAAEDCSSSSFVFEANGCPLDRALIATGVTARFSRGFTLCIVEGDEQTAFSLNQTF